MKSVRDRLLEEADELDRKSKLLTDAAYQLRNGLTGEFSGSFSMELEIVMNFGAEDDAKDLSGYIISLLMRKR